MNAHVSVRLAAVFVCAVRRMGFHIVRDLFLSHDLFALYKASAAVFACIFAFRPRSTAAFARGIIDDLFASDLFLRFSGKIGRLFERFGENSGDHGDHHREDDKAEKEAYDAHNDPDDDIERRLV